MAHMSKKNVEEEARIAVAKAAIRQGLTTEDVLRQAARKAGHSESKARRIAKRHMKNGGHVPKTIRSHVLAMASPAS
jgi:transposase